VWSGSYSRRFQWRFSLEHAKTGGQTLSIHC
jgi:hypothetical protein